MKKIKNSLSNRMKSYEAVNDTALMKKCPVVLRFDGVAFHTFTKGFKKPFDDLLITTMQETMLDLCKNIQGAVFGYTQSDEISIVLIDYQTYETDAWMKYRLEKICSIGGSMASRFFNKNFIKNVELLKSENKFENVVELAKYERKIFTADFDCRAFNVPKEDVCNCILWRQQDAEKNSVQMLAQSLYTYKELDKISVKMLQNKMFTEKGVNWNELAVPKKRGTACKKDENNKWFIDYNMPILKEDREYVEKTILI